MQNYNISLNDINKNYFHFTFQNNFENIKKVGLIPQKGKHAEHIEKTKKVFFVEGLDNLLILFDSWITVYKHMPLIPNFKITYGLGSKAMRSKYFPSFLIDIYFFFIKNSKRHKNYAYKIFNEQISKCILLNLNIQENVDFSFSDIDEIKSQGYRKRHLIELGYSEKYSNMNSNKMDRWNLHTKSNKGIPSAKLKLCQINNSSNIKDIIKFAIQNTNLNLLDTCPVLDDFLKDKLL